MTTDMSEVIRVVVDAMGGDNAPGEIVKGAAAAAVQGDGLKIFLTGREELIRAIDRTIFIKNENMAINRLQCSADEIVITNRSQEIGESHENLYGEYNGEPIDISFSANYVISAAKYIGGKTIKICFSGQMKPFVILNTEDDSILQLVLPVRTYN